MTDDNPNIEEECNLTLPGEEEEVKRRAYRLEIGVDIETLGQLSDEELRELHQSFETVLNDWFSFETPSGVEVTTERLE